jgi:hypothetical protein
VRASIFTVLVTSVRIVTAPPLETISAPAPTVEVASAFPNPTPTAKLSFLKKLC